VLGTLRGVRPGPRTGYGSATFVITLTSTTMHPPCSRSESRKRDRLIVREVLAAPASERIEQQVSMVRPDDEGALGSMRVVGPEGFDVRLSSHALLSERAASNRRDENPVAAPDRLGRVKDADAAPSDGSE
jgi:hypothetical protein